MEQKQAPKAYAKGEEGNIVPIDEQTYAPKEKEETKREEPQMIDTTGEEDKDQEFDPEFQKEVGKAAAELGLEIT